MTPPALDAIIEGVDSVLTALTALVLCGVALVCGAWCYVARCRRDYVVLCQRFTATDGSVVTVTIRLAGRVSPEALRQELDAVAVALGSTPPVGRVINGPR